MHKPSIGLAKEGAPFIGFCALATLTLGLIGCQTGASIFLILTFFVLHFFRDPERVVPTAPGLAVSPADGKVIKVGPMPDPFTGEERTAICVFMNVFNVHVNRMPVTGRIDKIEYIPGKYFNASFDKASKDNERNMLRIEDESGQFWSVVQIAGLIARRIICWGEEGDSLKRGQRFGLIKFGSRVDIYLPSGYEPIVTVGQKVIAGQTTLAKANHTDNQDDRKEAHP